MITINRQNLADYIKGFVDGTRAAGLAKRIVGKSIQEFETLPWVPMAFDDAMKMVAPHFTITDEGVSYEGTDEAAMLELDALFRRYRSLIAGDRELTAEQAAEHLNISLDQFKTYAYRQKKIASRMVGKTALFSERELNRFDLEERRPRGRQPVKPEAEG